MATEYRKEYLVNLQKYQKFLNEYFSDVQTPDFQDVKDEYDEVVKELVTETKSQVMELKKLGITVDYTIPSNFLNVVEPPKKIENTDTEQRVGDSEPVFTTGTTCAIDATDYLTETFDRKLTDEELIIKLFGSNGPYSKENAYNIISKDLEKLKKEFDWIWWLMPPEIKGVSDTFGIEFHESTVKKFLTSTFKGDEYENGKKWVNLLDKLNKKIKKADDFEYFVSDLDIKKALTFYITWCIWRAEFIGKGGKIVNSDKYKLGTTLESLCNTFRNIQEDIYNTYAQKIKEINVFRKSKGLRQIVYNETTNEFLLSDLTFTPPAPAVPAASSTPAVPAASSTPAPDPASTPDPVAPASSTSAASSTPVVPAASSTSAASSTPVVPAASSTPVVPAASSTPAPDPASTPDPVITSIKDCDNYKKIYETYDTGYEPPVWVRDNCSNLLRDYGSKSLLLYFPEDELDDVNKLAYRREPVNIGMTRSYNMEKLKKDFKYETGVYEELSGDGTKLPPQIAIACETPIRKLDGKTPSEQKILSVVSIIGFAFDNTNQPDYKYFITNNGGTLNLGALKKAMVKSYLLAFQAAKTMGKTTLAASPIGDGAFRPKVEYPGKPGMTRFREEVVFPAMEEASKSFPGITLEKAIYKTGDPNHFNILESFFNNSKWSKNLNTTLFVNAWDCWSMLGNGNFGDDSADGFWGRTTAISLLGWTGSNSQIKRQPVEITGTAASPLSYKRQTSPTSKIRSIQKKRNNRVKNLKKEMKKKQK